MNRREINVVTSRVGSWRSRAARLLPRLQVNERGIERSRGKSQLLLDDLKPCCHVDPELEVLMLRLSESDDLLTKTLKRVRAAAERLGHAHERSFEVMSGTAVVHSGSPSSTGGTSKVRPPAGANVAPAGGSFEATGAPSWTDYAPPTKENT